MDSKKIISQDAKYIVPTYTRNPLVIVKGKGMKVWDSRGRQYLDFFPGWGVSGLGHCPDSVIKAIKKQADILLHIPNNYHNLLQGALAKLLVKMSFKGKVFFCNSGAEANEAAIKLAKKWGQEKGKYEIVCMLGSFHGRTIGAITATGQKKYQKDFKPLVPGFKHVPFNDISALKKEMGKKTCAVMLELIQGEGGINVADKGFVKEVRKLCNKHNCLLIIDEVQTGIGRTGKMFAYQDYGIEPDIMTLAKALGGGMPIGAMIAADKISSVLGPATHASTFGGSPIVCAASIATLETIKKEKLIANANKMGRYLYDKLVNLQEKYPVVTRIKGKSLMVGIELSIPGDPVFKECVKRGLLINCTQGNILRFLPALNVTKEQINKAVSIIDKAIYTVTKETK
ncbi:MAG: aspartate aminotransferase family protein [bacterium]